MASPGDLVAVIAKSLGLPQVTVYQHDRNLVEAGLRTKGGRGSSAARMTADDAAKLLIATVSSLAVKDTVEALNLYGAMARSSGQYKEIVADVWTLTAFPIPELQSLALQHTFLEALSAIISAAARQRFRAVMLPHSSSIYETNISIVVEFVAPVPVATIQIAGVSSGGSFSEWHSYEQGVLTSSSLSQPAMQELFKKLDALGDLHQRRYFTEKTINALGNLLREG